MEIKEIVINHYGPLRDVKHRPKSGLQVFYGPNESGKTMLIDAILKLMLGNRLRDFADIDRVPDLPQGRVALAIDGKEHFLDGNSRLDKVTGLDSNHLRNVFVIRNKDLQISGQANFLQRVSDQLTGMEGRRLEDLRDILRKRGHLTNPSSTAKLSKSNEFNKIGEHVETAEAVANQMGEYLDLARTKELDTLERQVEETRLSLVGIENQIKDQELAKKWQHHSSLSEMVKEYEIKAEIARSLQAYTKKTFMKLQDLDSRARATRDTAMVSINKLDQLQPRLEAAAEKLADYMAQLAPRENQRPKLDNLEQRTLLAAGTPTPPAVGMYSRFSFALVGLAALGMLLAALDRLPSLLLATPVVAVAGAVGLFLADRHARSKAHEFRRRDRSLLQEGAASGIMAETLQQLAAAVAREKTGLEQARSRQQQLAETVRDMEQQRRHLEENISACTVLAVELEQQMNQDLQNLGVDSLERFGMLMEKYNRAQIKRDELYQSLEQNFDQVPVHTDKWCDLLSQIPIPKNPGIAFDSNKLTKLREEQDSTIEQIDQGQSELHRHQTTLDSFAAACQALPLEQETGCSLPTKFSNLEILEHARSILDLFVTKIKTRHGIACHTLAILEELEHEEREKMTNLVGPDKPVQDIFHTITQGRYTDILLDTKLNIFVKSRVGLELPASSLSQGTYDQLYLALRLSLAQDILEGKPGFLLLDDAFLCADSVRMDKMLTVLSELAVKGWHILYFTMDERMTQAVSRHTSNAAIHLTPLP